MGNRVGQHLGHYRLTRLLGQGGFAEVYLAEHLHLGTEAAIKVLYTHLVSADEVEAFRTEARTIARLKHPNIIRVFDFGLEEGIPYLVMDYFSAGTLRQRYPKGSRLDLATIITYVKQVAAALHYAHECKLIHRDVKPENMLLGEHSEVVLSDFGIAIVAQSSRDGHALDTVGTISYMAPEQIRAHPRPASDQYALGVVVYEWLTGERPFTGSFTEIAAKQCTVSPPPLRQTLPGISPRLEQVIFTALAKDPKERFASVLAFATALEQASIIEPAFILTVPPLPPGQPTQQSQLQTKEIVKPENVEALPVVLEPPAIRPSAFVVPPPSNSSITLPNRANSTSTVKASPLLRRRFSRRIIVAGLAVLTVAGGGVGWWASTSTSTHVTPIEKKLYTYRGHSDVVRAVAWSPDGRRIASGSGDRTVQVWDASTGAHVYTYQGQFGVNTVAWSPNGTRIVSGSEDSTVQIWDANTGTLSDTYQEDSDAVFAAAWSPDGTRIALANANGNVQVWDVSTGALLYTYKGLSGTAYTVVWSPDGRRMASSGSDEHTMQVWDASTGTRLYSTRHSVRGGKQCLRRASR